MPIVTELHPQEPSAESLRKMSSMSLKQLRRLLELKKIDTSGCLEKEDLVQKVKDWNLENEDLDKLEEEEKRKVCLSVCYSGLQIYGS